MFSARPWQIQPQHHKKYNLAQNSAVYNKKQLLSHRLVCKQRNLHKVTVASWEVRWL